MTQQSVKKLALAACAALMSRSRMTSSNAENFRRLKLDGLWSNVRQSQPMTEFLDKSVHQSPPMEWEDISGEENSPAALTKSQFCPKWVFKDNFSRHSDLRWHKNQLLGRNVTFYQRWALSVFLKIFNNKKDLFANHKNHFFVIENLQKYRKCLALHSMSTWERLKLSRHMS